MRKLNQDSNCLDIATGTTGIETAKLVVCKGRVIGVDISERMLSQAKQKVEALKH